MTALLLAFVAIPVAVAIVVPLVWSLAAVWFVTVPVVLLAALGLLWRRRLRAAGSR
jgi:hypothetical protein